jgi:tRNA (mo5U34)-methyltransferase
VTDAGAAVAANPLWYHTMELAPGVVTPGWFDLRPVLDALPWPDVAGKRCLDVGTYDGHLAFELERRGAAEVVATDLSDHSEWDWPIRLRALDGEHLDAIAGPEKGRGFRIAAELLGSRVERVECSVYDLSPERHGTFDVVVCGSLLLHLRDPIRALEAVRSVCSGTFLSAEQILPRLEWGARSRRPLAELDGVSDLCQWWTPNRAGHRRMVEAAGFDVERAGARYCLPLGPAHPRPPRTAARLARAAGVWLMTRESGLLSSAVLARPVAAT